VYCEPQLREIIARVKPDVIVEDNVLCFPALTTAGVPFVRIVSCNPLEMKGPGVAPAFSGYAQSDPDSWPAFRAEYERTHRGMWEAFNEFVVASGAAPLPDLEFIHSDNAANLYVYPKEADYVAERPLDASWTRMDSSVRTTDSDYVIPAEVANRPEGSALIYLSLGSLGSADVGLMKRLVEVLGKTPHRYIVSKGPQHTEYELADNMVGAEFVPQTRIIPEVDLVITHGGNNTTTESLHFGKPMILLPLFWDQYDNAQRIHELGFGRRLATYAFTDEEMNDALTSLLGDAELRARLTAMGEAIRSRDGLRVGADVIERVGREHVAS
jgi:MGT family glycosyltransferase